MSETYLWFTNVLIFMFGVAVGAIFSVACEFPKYFIRKRNNVKPQKRNAGCLNCCNYAHEDTATHKIEKFYPVKGSTETQPLYTHNCKAYTDATYNCASGKTTHLCHHCEMYNTHGNCKMFNKPISALQQSAYKKFELKIYYWMRKQYERLDNK
jgi:hypothetical protein